MSKPTTRTIIYNFIAEEYNDGKTEGIEDDQYLDLTWGMASREFLDLQAVVIEATGKEIHLEDVFGSTLGEIIEYVDSY